MLFFKRRRILKSTNSLDLIPVRIYDNDEVDGKVVINVPKFENKGIHFFFPGTKKLFYRIKLDNTGSLVWRKIDGKRKIHEITENVMRELQDEVITADEFQGRILKFMSTLYDRRYITFKQLVDE